MAVFWFLEPPIRLRLGRPVNLNANTPSAGIGPVVLRKALLAIAIVAILAGVVQTFMVS